MRSGLNVSVAHRQPFAAEGAQFADQRPVAAGDDGARARLQHRQSDVDRAAAGRIVAQRRRQLQDRDAGERAPCVVARANQRFAPLALGGGLRREGAGPDIAFILDWPQARMSEARLTSLTIESPLPARTIAVRAREGKGEKKSPGLFWLGGFMSDMKGTKAQALDRWAERQGRACLRFDYSGHGESGGDFKQGTIGGWLEESVAVYARFAQGPQVVVGSSMGGWLALLLARELHKPQRCSRRSPAWC